jgi:hypothetical protein
MFLSGVPFVLFLAGCWLYCLIDAALTPAADFPGLRKRGWIAVIAVTFILGAIAWVIVRKSLRTRRRLLTSADQPALANYHNVLWYPDQPTTPADPFLTEALARHPASRSRNTGPIVPIGPDDDPEFLRELAERIRGDQ